MRNTYFLGIAASACEFSRFWSQDFRFLFCTRHWPSSFPSFSYIIISERHLVFRKPTAQWKFTDKFPFWDSFRRRDRKTLRHTKRPAFLFKISCILFILFLKSHAPIFEPSPIHLKLNCTAVKCTIGFYGLFSSSSNWLSKNNRAACSKKRKEKTISGHAKLARPFSKRELPIEMNDSKEREIENRNSKEQKIRSKSKYESDFWYSKNYIGKILVCCYQNQTVDTSRNLLCRQSQKYSLTDDGLAGIKRQHNSFVKKL